MPLIGRKPKASERHLKMVGYGGPGAGKTTFAANLPKVYFIDTEGGALDPQYLGPIVDNGGAYLGPSDGSTNYETVLGQVKALGSEEHGYDWLVFDSGTELFQPELDRQADIVGTQYGANRLLPDRRARQLSDLIKLLNMHVFVVAHEKPEYKKVKNSRGVEESQLVGFIPDIYKKVWHALDATLHFQKSGGSFDVYTTKSRITGLPQDRLFQDFSYARLAELVNDPASLPAVAEPLASDELVEELLALIEARAWPAEGIQHKGHPVGWQACLDKYLAKSWSDVPAKGVESFIAFVKKTDPDELTRKKEAAA